MKNTTHKRKPNAQRLTLDVVVGKKHLYLVSLAVALFMLVILVVAYETGGPSTLFGHTGDEIDVIVNSEKRLLNDVLDDFSSIPNQKTVVVHHSLSPRTPGCMTGWTKLWEGYTYLGGRQYRSASYSPQDLGGTGSCLESFHPSPFQRCEAWNAGFFCESGYATQYSAWLTGQNAVSNTFSFTRGFEYTGTSRDIGSDNAVPSFIGRCTVCENQETTVIVRHGVAASSPQCPGGWDELWRGKSFAHVGRDTAHSAPQDLSSTGSCIEHFVPQPLVTCSATSCKFGPVSNEESAAWMSARATITTQSYDSRAPPFTDLANAVADCVVCSR